MNYPSPEFDDAVSALCHGTVNDDAWQELHELLRADKNARDEYLWRVEVHGELASGRLDFGNASPCEETEDERKPITPSHRDANQTGQRGWRSTAIGLALVALLLLIALVGERWIWHAPANPGNKSRVVARFGELHNCRWVDSDSEFRLGNAIESGQRIELSSGSAEVIYNTGARLTIVGPAIVKLQGDNGVFLMLGKVLLVAETPESKGFTVVTPTTKFVDMGTEFRATVASDGLSLLEVAEGEVDVVLKDAEVASRFRAGESLYVEPGERQVVTRIERGDGTPAFRFPTIKPPSREDYADRALGNATIRVVHGQLNGHSADVLLDGVGQSHQDAPQESAFFERRGGFLLDLGKAIPISRINSYSWHQHDTIEEHRNRAQQRFTLYGFSGDELPDLNIPPEEASWTRIARVNSDQFFEVRDSLDRPAQQACSITGSGGNIGQFRYLLWEVRRGTFYGEIDVYGPPSRETQN